MSFLDLVKSRYSVRNYALRTVEQEKLDYVMECVRLSPSAVNFQPWKFAIVQEKEQLEALKNSLSEGVDTVGTLYDSCLCRSRGVLAPEGRRKGSCGHRCGHCRGAFVSGGCRTGTGNLLGMQF